MHRNRLLLNLARFMLYFAALVLCRAGNIARLHHSTANDAGWPQVGLFAGGAFNYSEYHRVRWQYGWSPWPVRVFWVCALLGIALLGVAVVKQYGIR